MFQVYDMSLLRSLLLSTMLEIIRRATPDEAEQLTELALRSKGHWGYDAEFLRDCRIDLTLTPEFVATCPVFVLEEQGSIAGFYSLSAEDAEDVEVELIHLFVEPRAIGRGFGKLLFRHAVETARRLGFQRLLIGSDPFALKFYEAMGARRVGEVASIVRPGRMLPLLHYPLLSTHHQQSREENSSPAL